MLTHVSVPSTIWRNTVSYNFTEATASMLDMPLITLPKKTQEYDPNLYPMPTVATST